MKTELDSLQWHSFRNDASTAAPAYGILRLTGVSEAKGLTFLTADQPNTSETAYAVNGPAEVPAGSYGRCVLFGHCVFVYDTGTPAFNDFYSAKNGQWTANKTGNFIRCLGVIDSTNKFALGVIGRSGDSNFCNAVLKSDLIAGGASVQAEVLDNYFLPLSPRTMIAVIDGCMASGAFAAGAIVWVEKGTQNMVRGLSCVNEMEV